MTDRVMQFRVGVMVLATAIIAGILVVLFGDLPSLVQATYPLKMSFNDARGVAGGTPVRKNGILVGRVTSVMLDERGGVSVVADIDSYVPIYRDEVARISSTILGDAEIQLVPFLGAGRVSTNLQEGTISGDIGAGGVLVRWSGAGAPTLAVTEALRESAPAPAMAAGVESSSKEL